MSTILDQYAALPGAEIPGRLINRTGGNGGVYLDTGERWYSITNDVWIVKARGDVVGSGNDEHDDTDGINAVLKDAACLGGGTVFLPPGTYLITKPLLIGNNINLIGCGSATVIKMKNPGMVGRGIENMDKVNGNAHIRISNFKMDGGRFTPPAALNGPSVIWKADEEYSPDPVAGTFVVVSNVGIFKCIKGGRSNSNPMHHPRPLPDKPDRLILDGTVKWMFIEPHWEAYHDLMYFKNCTDIRVRDVELTMSRNDGVIFEKSFECVIENCHAHDINKAAIYYSKCRKGTASNNSFVNNYSDIAVATTWNVSLANNLGLNSVWSHIILGRDSRYCQIQGNQGGQFICALEPVSDVDETGINHPHIQGIDYPELQGEDSPKRYLYYLYGYSFCNVIGNNFSRVTMFNCHHNRVNNNIITNDDYYGFQVEGSTNNYFSNNIVHNAGSSEFPWGFCFRRIIKTDNNIEHGQVQNNIDSKFNRLYFNTVWDDRVEGISKGITFDEFATDCIVYGNMVHLGSNMDPENNGDLMNDHYYNMPNDLAIDFDQNLQQTHHDGSFDFDQNIQQTHDESIVQRRLTWLPPASERWRGNFMTSNLWNSETDTVHVCIRNRGVCEWKRLSFYHEFHS